MLIPSATPGAPREDLPWEDPDPPDFGQASRERRHTRRDRRRAWLQSHWQSITGAYVKPGATLPVDVHPGMSRHAFEEYRSAVFPTLVVVLVTLCIGITLSSMVLLLIGG